MTAVDQAVRDRAIHDTAHSFAMAAGAGSGKTTVLTQRVLQLLVDGLPPARVAAITFTEKAAGELQERVRDALEKRLAAAPDPTLEAALQQLPELQLSTIHSFCQRLLTLEALDAAWAPETEVLPTVVGAEGVAAAYRHWQSGFADRHPRAALVVQALVNKKTLREGALRLLAYRDLSPVVAPLPFDPVAAHGGLLEVHQHLVDAAAGCANPDGDKLLANNATLRATVAAAASAPPGQGVVQVLMTGMKRSRSGGRAGDWPGGGKQVFLAALERAQDWYQGQLTRVHGTLLLDLSEHFVPHAQAAKAAHAVADFDDLLFRAAELLADDTVRARLARRFDALLVDEVQDTDPIQAEVAALLTRPPTATGPWNAHAPAPGHLFAVGDPQQSIYRFRRADVAIWNELQGLIAQGGERLALTQNFRSVPGIVDWVNTTFADLPGYVAQAAYRSPAAADPVVQVPCGELDEDDAVARYLHHLLPVTEVVDRDSGMLRPMRWSDVMVLLPAWSKAEALQATLVRAGIPCLVEGGAAFFGRDEVRVAMAALKALDEPADAENTVLALRGLFGIDWATLAAHKAAEGSWRRTVPDPPPGPVAEAYRVLNELARQRGRRPWVDLLDELLESTRAAAVWAARHDGAARLANLDKLRALLRQVEQGARSPGEALRALDDLAQEKDKDLSRSDLDSDAVRITSYFKAKGLEAPVVLLCHAHRTVSGVQAAVDRPARQVALRISPLVPPGWEEREAADKAAAEDERRRWMYVAATRARDHLVLFVPDKANLLAHLGTGLSTTPLIEASSLPEVPWREHTFPGLDDAVDGWLADPSTLPGRTDPTDAWHARRVTAVRRARAGCTRWRSVQQVAARERVGRAHSAVGVHGGQVVHDVLEGLDLARSLEALRPQVLPLATAAGAAAGLSDDTLAACVDIVHRILAHPVLDRARVAPERWVEVPFSVRDRDRVVSGRIDLAFPTDATRTHWVVVDWKSDLPARDTAAWRNYQRQLGWYAKALLATVSPCEAVETVLVGPYVELDDGDAAEDALQEVLPELADALRELLDAGAPVPVVGADVGEPIAAVAELAWVDEKVALCVGQPEDDVAALREQGWAVVAVDADGVGWARPVAPAMAEHLGLAGTLGPLSGEATP